MAGQSTNSANIQFVRRSASDRVYIITHPEYQYWLPDWIKTRDVIAGQREVKFKGEIYLRKLPGSDKKDYREYLDGAVFFNMAAQTLSGMSGPVFRRSPTVKKIPDKLRDRLNAIGRDGSTHTAFTKTVIKEQLSMGRYGVLVDAPSAADAERLDNPTQALPYAVGYRAEDILDWSFEVINGYLSLTRVLLREWRRYQINQDGGQVVSTVATSQNAPRGAKNPYVWPYRYQAIYRELIINQNGAYQQNVYVENPNGAPDETYNPVIRGNAMTYIPFVFFGASGNEPDVEKPPLLDIIDLNLSHYRTYADLEHGRRYTALPTYFAPGGALNGAAEYHIGPSMVWEVPVGSEPGILEYKGDGLKTLERALLDKQGQIAAIGGRLLPGMGQGISESTEQATMRGAAEQSLLLNVIIAANDGMSKVIRYWADFQDFPLSTTLGIRYTINTDFLSAPIGARELRAIQLMYAAGLIPIQTIYDYLLKAEVLDDDMALADFTTLLNDENAFLNNPDVIAKQKGFNTRQQELDQEQRLIEEDFQRQELALQREQLALEGAAADDESEAHDQSMDQGDVALQSSKLDLANKKKAAADAAKARRNGTPPAGGQQPLPGQPGGAAPPAGPIAGGATLAKPGLSPAPDKVPTPGAKVGKTTPGGSGAGITISIK